MILFKSTERFYVSVIYQSLSKLVLIKSPCWWWWCSPTSVSSSTTTSNIKSWRDVFIFARNSMTASSIILLTSTGRIQFQLTFKDWKDSLFVRWRKGIWFMIDYGVVHRLLPFFLLSSIVYRLLVLSEEGDYCSGLFSLLAVVVLCFVVVLAGLPINPSRRKIIFYRRQNWSNRHLVGNDDDPKMIQIACGYIQYSMNIFLVEFISICLV